MFGKGPLDEPLEKQRAELKSEPDILRTAALTGLDCDQLPNGSGSFGHTPANPVPVNGVRGEFKYLNRLRSGRPA